MSERADAADGGEVDGGDRLVTSDPARLRALAHPIRVELLRLLDDLGEATATELAERIGESPSNCSFHLRQLAKAGYIERGEARGTAKPWRSAHRFRDLRPDPSDPASVRSLEAISAMQVRLEADRVDRYLTSGQMEPEWMAATIVLTSAFWATPDEVTAFNEELHSLSARFKGRSDDATLRPEGARLVRLFATVNADPTSEPIPAADAAPPVSD